jgi:hypothetical protein
MYLLSSRDAREEYELLRPVDDRPVPTFGETFRASRDYAVDEMLSISYAFNNQAFFDRQAKIREMRNAGFNFDPYTNEKGQLDYDRVAKDTGLIRTSGELRTEKNEMLAERRAYAQDVMDRGPGLATFAGMGTAFMFGDPINVSTLPIGFGTAAKGLSVLGHTLRGARNTAALGVATELAIQPLVYNHKHDINSPYEVQDAINTIAIVGLTAGVLGGAIGGISGYFTRAAEVAAEEAAAAIKFTEIRPIPGRFYDFKFMGVDPRYNRPTYADMGTPILERATAELTELAGKRLSNAQVKAIKAEQRQLTERILKLDAPRARGGRTPKADKKIETAKARLIELDRQLDVHDAAKAARADLNRIEQGIIPARYDRQIKEAMEGQGAKLMDSARIFQRTADSLARQRGFVATDLPLQAYKLAQNAGASAPKVREAVVKAIAKSIAERSKQKVEVNGVPQISKDVEELKSLMRRVQDAELSELDNLMQSLHKQAIDNDVALMKSMAAREAEMSLPQYKPSMFVGPEMPKAAKAPTTPLERDSLIRNGLDEDYDNIMAAFEALPNKKILNEAGEEVDANSIVKAADEELESLESIMRCSRG